MAVTGALSLTIKDIIEGVCPFLNSMASNSKFYYWSFGPSSTSQPLSSIYISLRSQYAHSNLDTNGGFAPYKESYTGAFVNFYFGLRRAGLNSNFYSGSFAL
jgi:hypothetical protein